MDEQSGLVALSEILIVELKRGGAEISRDNVHQASDYVEDLLKSGLLDGAPRIRAYLVGHSINPKVEPNREIGGNPVFVVTYNQLTRSAQKRLFRLRERLASRYAEVTGNDLLAKVLAEPTQLSIQCRDSSISCVVRRIDPRSAFFTVIESGTGRSKPSFATIKFAGHGQMLRVVGLAPGTE